MLEKVLQHQVGMKRKFISLMVVHINHLDHALDRPVILAVTQLFAKGVLGRYVVSQFAVLIMGSYVTDVITGTMLTAKKSRNKHTRLWCSTKLSRLCPECKKAVKNGDTKRMISLESKVDQVDKSMRERAKLVSEGAEGC